MTRICTLIAIVAVGTTMAHAADFDVRAPDAFAKLLPETSKVEKVADGMQFTEGPVWTNADGGYLVFSDIDGNELKRWDEIAVTPD